MAEKTVLKSSPVLSSRQQSVQTDDLIREADTSGVRTRRSLLTNFSHALLLSPPSQMSSSRKFSSSIYHPKAKLIFAYETRDHIGKLIEQPCMTIDEAEGQVRLIRPSPASSPTARGISSAPKNFPSDGTFSDQDSTKAFCAAVLSDQISALVNGNDGCVIYLNTINNKNASRFVGSDSEQDGFGLIPSSIHGLFNALNNQRSTHFYLTVSAVEISNSTDQKSTDLFSELKSDLDPEGKRLGELKSRIFSWKGAFPCRSDDERTELVAATVAEAAHYLDVALEVSRRFQESSGTFKSPAHFVFTLNIYRSRSGATVTASNKMEHCQLNLIELMLPSELSNDSPHKTSSIMDFIVDLISGRASPPFGSKEPTLYHLLRSCLLTENLIKLSLVLHVSVLSNFYARNLELFQKASKIQHIWKRRPTSKSQRRRASINDRNLPSPSAQMSSLSSIHLRRLGRRMQKRRLARNTAISCNQDCDDMQNSNSDFEYTSSSEQSCTTVIYLGRSHPLRKMNAADRVKKLTASEKKEAITKAEEKAEMVQVRPTEVGHRRRFKSRSGHKAHAGTATNELWVDGPNVTADFPITSLSLEKAPHSPLRERSEPMSERHQPLGVRGQTSTADKGVPDGKAFNTHENFERNLESCMRNLKWSTESPDSANSAKQLEALITPRIDRKVRRGNPFPEAQQKKQLDRIQQTTNTSDFPEMPNCKYDSFPSGIGSATHGVKPFVKEWVEKQNQAIANYFTEQPLLTSHGTKQLRVSTKADGQRHIGHKTVETPQLSRKHRDHESKKQIEMGDLLITSNDSATHSHSLPRQVTAEIPWTTQQHPVRPAADNLSRVAQWVESVSTPEQTLPVNAKGCSKHPLQCSALCRSCNKTTYIANPPTSPEIAGRGSSAPAARFRSQKGTMIFHTIEENQQPHATSTNATSDPRKPDGASDPGLHRDRSFGSVSGIDTIREALKLSPLKKPVLKRFADLFVCSPTANRRRQQHNLHHQQPEHERSEHVSKTCVPLFAAVSPGRRAGERETEPEGDLLSIDSVGMLFTSMSKGSGIVGDESLFTDSEKTGRKGSNISQSSPKKHSEESLSGRLRMKEAGTKHRFGFLQSPLFNKRNTGQHDMPPETISPASPQSSALPSNHFCHPAQSSKQHQQQDRMAFHCQVVLEKSPTTHCHRKCVSQSSSSGLGSEHSEQHSLRCHYSMGPNGSRMRRCRMRTHRKGTGALGTPEVEQEGGATAKYGGHASSGYESILRDDSEFSSQSSSGSSYPWPLAGAKEAASQTTPSDFMASAIITSQTSAVIPEALTASFTDTVTVSGTGDTMLASTTSRTSGERSLSTSTSKRSHSAPAGSSDDSKCSSLPSVRRISPQGPQASATNHDALEISILQLNLNRPELTRANSDAVEVVKSISCRQRRIKILLQRQEKLKAELTDAKLRLLADPGSWSFDLNVAEHMDPNDDGYLEALSDETELLQQRVDACRSHAQYLAFFHPDHLSFPQSSTSGGGHESPR